MRELSTMHMPRFCDKDHRLKFGLGHMYSTRNKILHWVPADTEEKFDANWADPKKRKILIENNWTKDSITYKSNDLGFRMPDDMINIKPNECEFYIGCSHTFGIGLNLEDTWGWKLSQKRGLTFVNLSWPGGGIESQYRLLRAWAEKLKPKAAFTLGTYYGRREILRADGTTERLGWWIKDGPMRIVHDRLANENEIFLSTIRTIDAMKAVCVENNIKLYTLDDKIRYEILSATGSDMTARDLMHFNPAWHSRIADMPESYWGRLA